MRYLFLSLSILTTIFIFGNSLRTGSASSSQSNVITNVVVDVVENVSNQPQNHQQLSYIVRKMAHFSEFLVLGALYSITLMLYKVKYYLPISLSMALSVALIDEFIQLFIEERVGSLGDSMIDFMGSVSGIILVSIFLREAHNK